MGAMLTYLKFGGIAIAVSLLIGSVYYIHSVISENKELTREIGQKEAEITSLQGEIDAKQKLIAKMESSRDITDKIIADYRDEVLGYETKLIAIEEEAESRIYALRSEYEEAYSNPDASEEDRMVLNTNYVSSVIDDLKKEMREIYCHSAEEGDPICES